MLEMLSQVIQKSGKTNLIFRFAILSSSSLVFFSFQANIFCYQYVTLRVTVHKNHQPLSKCRIDLLLLPSSHYKCGEVVVNIFYLSRGIISFSKVV